MANSKGDTQREFKLKTLPEQKDLVSNSVYYIQNADDDTKFDLYVTGRDGTLYSLNQSELDVGSPDQIPGLQEYVEDLLGTSIVAGTNVTVEYNDTEGTVTISSVGGGGGGGITTEDAVDAVAAALRAAQSFLTITYDDPVNELSITIDVADLASNIDYSDLQNKPTLSPVAATGSYNDLADKPTIPDDNFRGTFLNLAALQAGIPAGNLGDYAYIDQGPGLDALIYIWDNTDNDWVAGGQGGVETPSSVKTKYESNADTNAFTDAEKTKLGNVPSNTITELAGKQATISSDELAALGRLAGIEDPSNEDFVIFIDASGNIVALEVATIPDPSALTVEYRLRPDGAGGMEWVIQPAQVSVGERTAGTETAIRLFSPEDIASMAGTHGGGGGGGTVDVVSNVATNSILGRTGVGSGDSEELTATQVRTLINVEDGSTADQTGSEIVSAIDTELGGTTWQGGGGGSSLTTAVLIGDETISTTGSWREYAEFLISSVAVGRYAISGGIIFGTVDATPKVGMDIDSGTASGFIRWEGDKAEDPKFMEIGAGDIVLPTVPGNDNFIVPLTGWIHVTATAAIQLKFDISATTGNDLVIYENSHIILTPIS